MFFITENSAPNDPYISIPLTSTPADNVYSVFKLRYTYDANGACSYEFLIDGTSQGTVQTATDQQKYHTINDLLFNVSTGTYVKDMYVYDGLF